MLMEHSLNGSFSKAVLCQLHIGHTLFTHFYSLKSEEPPVCTPCDQLCSVESLLTECVDLMECSRQFSNTEALKVLFRECSPDNIIHFFKQTSLLDKL